VAGVRSTTGLPAQRLHGAFSREFRLQISLVVVLLAASRLPRERVRGYVVFDDYSLLTLTAYRPNLLTVSSRPNVTIKGKGSPYSIVERRVSELITVLGSQPAGDVSHKPGGRLPLLSARPAVTPCNP